MAAALDWREHGPPARAGARRRAGAASSGSSPGPSSGRLLGELEEAAFTGEASDARRQCRSRRPASESATRDRRLRGLRGRAAARRRAWTSHERDARRAGVRTLRLDRAVRAAPRRSSSRSRASSTSTRWPWRTPSTRTSGPSSRCSATWSSSSSRRPATSTRTEVIKLGEILVFLGHGLRHHRPPRRGQRPGRRARAARGEPRAAAARARARCCTRSSTGWWTTTRPRSPASGEDIEQVEDQVFSAVRAERGGAHLQAQARGAPVRARRRTARGAG